MGQYTYLLTEHLMCPVTAAYRDAITYQTHGGDVACAYWFMRSRFWLYSPNITLGLMREARRPVMKCETAKPPPMMTDFRYTVAGIIRCKYDRISSVCSRLL